MEGRRARRSGRSQPTLLPIRAAPTNPSLSRTISCCYCEYKFSVLNDPLFHFGRKHARCLKLWFSIGVGFSLTALLVVALVLLWDLCASLHVVPGNASLPTSLLFGFSPSGYGLGLSVADAAFLFFSTLVSVTVHEFGHALAAASEGIQTEYVAIFVAFLFPGALVAFNYDLLEMLQRLNALRVYCAGIWHNAACCAVCGLVLFALPWILCPFYVHGQNPMVLDVPSTSPLFGYLSPGDVIVSLDGKQITNIQEWLEVTKLTYQQTLQYSNLSETFEGFRIAHNRKGYCVPAFMINKSNEIHLVQNQSSCSSHLTEFVPIQCFASSKLDDVNVEDGQPNRREIGYCLNARDVVKLDKCGDGWLTEITNGSNCLCSQDESCLSPVQFPGLMWAEITYSSPFSSGCLQVGRNLIQNSVSADLEHSCGGKFVFVGDLISMSHLVRLTAYQPRWSFAFISAYLPIILEKSLICTFHVSLTLALLNSLPVYFLDGESILEVALCHFTSLGRRKRAKVLQTCLLAGTSISVLSFMKIIFITVF